MMLAFTRGLLRQSSRHVPFSAAASAASSQYRKSSQTHLPHDSAEDDADRAAVAEAQVISSTSPSSSSAAWRNDESAGGVPANASRGMLHARRQATAAAAAAPLLSRPLTKPVILEDVQDTYAITPMQQVHGQSLWNGTQVLRGNKHARLTNAAVVVGGANAIRRIWRSYKIRPTVVYVPNTEPQVPAWCLEEELPTVIVRCSPVAVKRQLLSAEYSDGYAAQFPLPLNTITDAATLLTAAATEDPFSESSSSPAVKRSSDVAGNGEGRSGAAPQSEPHDADVPRADRPLHSPFRMHAVKAMLVLVGLRIPSNVGALLRAAVEMGYDAALLVNCVDATQEKVLRASDGTALSPTLRVYETHTTEQACVSLLSGIAAQHHLMPFLAVPSQEVDAAFEVAKRFHAYNNNANSQQQQQPLQQRTDAEGERETVKGGLRTPPPPRLGAMVVLGSEAQGLRDLHGTWSVPYQLVTLPLPNAMIDSYNVSVAGSVLMHLFRPRAAEHFERLLTLSGETVADLLPKATDPDAAFGEEEEDAGR